jgi:ATP-binding cassette subfamily B protein
MKHFVACCAWILRTAWRQDRVKTLVALVLMLSGAAALPVAALCISRFIDESVAGQAAGAVLWGAGLAVAVVAGLTFSHFAHIAYFELSEQSMLELDRDLIAAATSSRGLELHERPDHADRLSLVMRDVQQFTGAMQSVLGLAGAGTAIVTTTVLLVRLNPVLLVLLPLALVPLVTSRRAESILDQAKLRTTQATRAAQGWFRLTTDANTAGEVKVARMEDYLAARHRAHWDDASRRTTRAQFRAGLLRTAGQLVFTAGYVAGVLLVVADALDGRRSVGEVILSVTLAAQVNHQVATSVAQLVHLQRMTTVFVRLRELMAVPSAGLEDLDPPDHLRHGIDLDGVSFAYSDDAEPVLRDVTVRLPSGSTVAIVGENGAGKTSLVKLLCGFYRPTAGRILVDGADLSRIPAARWWARLSAVFQDFVRFELSAREAVGVGDVSALCSAQADDAVSTALGRAHASGAVEHLPAGLDTQLGRSHTDGVELSGGQWQKLALGRGFMRQQPLLLVLDEPAAALDAEAEHALFERYAEQARRSAAHSGTITLLVSHRFSTVRSADLILVLAGGQLVESGDHEQLMRADGLYAELCRLQARFYQ